jgi:hypothetical protein
MGPASRKAQDNGNHVLVRPAEFSTDWAYTALFTALRRRALR